MCKPTPAIVPSVKSVSEKLVLFKVGNNEELSALTDWWWRKYLFQFVNFPAVDKIHIISHLLGFFGTQSNSKGHKTFLRKKSVVGKLLETIWIWTKECCPQKFLVLFPCCCHVSHSWAFIPLCRISCCQVNLLSLSLKSHYSPSVLSTVHVGLKSLIGLEGIWLNGNTGLSSDLPSCLSLQSLGDVLWKWLSLECDLEMVSVFGL